jgi:hypothetical protein
MHQTSGIVWCLVGVSSHKASSTKAALLVQSALPTTRCGYLDVKVGLHSTETTRYKIHGQENKQISRHRLEIVGDWGTDVLMGDFADSSGRRQDHHR